MDGIFIAKLLMMKIFENLEAALEEFRAICEALEN